MKPFEKIGLHIGCGDCYLQDPSGKILYVNINMEIPGMTYLAQDAPHLVRQNKGTLGPGYYGRNFEDAVGHKRKIVCDLYADIRDLHQFRNESLDAIVAVQVLEHFSDAEAEACLRHWNSLLASGGSLYLSVPDFFGIAEEYIRAVQSQDRSRIDWGYRMIYGSQNYPGDAHLSGWDYDKLFLFLQKAGFTWVEREPSFHAYPAIAVRAFK